MNQVIESLLNHRSIRSYLDKPISQETIETIVRASQAAPSSINGQHVSIIVVTDKAKKDKLSELSGNQPWINEAPAFLIFCSDFYRAKLAADKNKVDFHIIDHLEATIIGSVDIGLAMQNAIIAAESLGCGIVPIGGIRNQVNEVVKLLGIPEYVFPICGLVIGYPKDNSEKKPRFPLNAVLNNETYNKDQMSFINQYDDTMSEYMLNRTKGQSDRNWSQTISRFYQSPSKRDVKKDMKNQGYKNN